MKSFSIRSIVLLCILSLSFLASAKAELTAPALLCEISGKTGETRSIKSYFTREDDGVSYGAQTPQIKMLDSQTVRVFEVSAQMTKKHDLLQLQIVVNESYYSESKMAQLQVARKTLEKCTLQNGLREQPSSYPSEKLRSVCPLESSDYIKAYDEYSKTFKLVGESARTNEEPLVLDHRYQMRTGSGFSIDCTVRAIPVLP